MPLDRHQNATAPRPALVIPVPDIRTLRRWLLTAAGCAIVLYLVYVVRDIWLPLGLAFLLATVLDPVVDRMEKRGWKRGTAAACIFGSFILIAGGLMWLATPAIMAQASAVQDQIHRYFPDTSSGGLLKSFDRLNVPRSVAAVGIRIFASAQSGIERSSSWLTEYGMRFVSNLVWVAIVPIVAFYALRDFHMILGKALLLVPRRKREVTQTYLSEVTGIFARYLRGLAIVSALNGTATWLLLAALRVPSAMLLGIVAGILYTVPYIGAILTIILTAALAFVGGGVHLMTIAVLASMVLHQIIFDQIISPRVLGGHVGLHPILSIIALLAGNLLLGVIGMVLAVPVAACIQIGVVALVPKLGMELNIAESPDTKSVDQMGAESADVIAVADATKDLHQVVGHAVTHVESTLEAS